MGLIKATKVPFLGVKRGRVYQQKKESFKEF
jgi:hypothetical protein